MSYKTTKIFAVIFFSILAIPFLNSCESSSADLIGDWIQRSSLDGNVRCGAVGFSIGSKGYLGTGYNGSSTATVKYLNDFWEYDPSYDAWTQKADFPGTPRTLASGFATDTKGYIGIGRTETTNLKDFYEYDPVSNTWTRKADFGGTARYSAVGFAINNKGYIGTGFDENCLKDFWQYDPETDTWTQKPSYGGGKREEATGFVIDGIGYIVTGVANGAVCSDFYSYDPSTEKWTKLRAIENLSPDTYDDSYGTANIAGYDKVGFALNGKGYVATGGQNTGTQVWEYDPGTDLWTERTSFEKAARGLAVAFVIDKLAYIATGKNSSTYMDDLYSFDPKAIYDQYDK